ncbi:MAG TPA: 1-deoxy-D-xylulose-5-phosphate synthase [Caldithrix sp.]|nr:1-deoxy-D-xylulose-5-phosphate synthase [Caldithrix sp.]
MPGLFFEDLGFRYFGPVNGHDLNELTQILRRIKKLPGPILLHVLTKKGKGYSEAEEHPDKYHGIKGTVQKKSKALTIPVQSYTDIFGKSICQLAEKSKSVCAITAAMCDGTGLNDFRDRFPERFFDVGIAEGHALTFAAGLAASGIRPVVSIYSTFLQRGFDQIIHDIALQKLPVIFTLDRAGLVGEDGPTHHGTFDISYLNAVPHLIVSAPKNGQELRDLLYTALLQDRQPFAIRYPRGQVPDAVDFDNGYREIPIGSWELVRQGKNVLILAVGTMVEESLQAAKLLRKHHIDPSVINCRFIKPLDEKMLHQLLPRYQQIFTVEENAIEGGFGAKISAFLNRHGYASHLNLHIKGIPDRFIEHGDRLKLLELSGLSAEKISDWILAKNKQVVEENKLLAK